jgi:ketosteroid isomerase-like protein
MKNLLILIIALTTSTGCNHSKINNMATSDNEKVVQQYFENFNNHEWTKMAEMYSETADFKDPSLGEGIVKQTRQQIIYKYSELNRVLPDLHDKIVKIYPSGDNHIIVEFISMGTAPDGSKFELPICTIFTIENGVITKDFTYYDNFDEEQGESNLNK